MLSFILSHIGYFIAGLVVILLVFVLRPVLKRKKLRGQEKEMSQLQKRNEALNETLRNPKIKTAEPAAVGPMEVQWDEKAVNQQRTGRASMMVELVEFSTYSRRKYLFSAEQSIHIGSGAENQLVLPREGIAVRHCEIFAVKDTMAVRAVGGETATLVRGKTTAVINGEGLLLNNGDHIRMGSADVQFRCFKA